jgi:hypothetical protein
MENSFVFLIVYPKHENKLYLPDVGATREGGKPCLLLPFPSPVLVST